jgi:hypothetical protein
MADREVVDPPEHITARVRAICDALPETSVREMSTGRLLWRVRGNTFAYLGAEARDGVTTSGVTFRAEGVELDAFLHLGHPFYPGWGGGLVLMLLDDDTDWDEVTEVLEDSYCVCAPKKLQRLVRGDATPSQ